VIGGAVLEETTPSRGEARSVSKAACEHAEGVARGEGEEEMDSRASGMRLSDWAGLLTFR